MAERYGTGGGNRAEAFEKLRADYSAAKSGRFRRRRVVPVMGGAGDYHYRRETDFLRIMEYARDMERNDAVVGPLLDQAVNNVVQGGLWPDPKTGDPGLDEAIKARWEEWATDATQCSADGEMTYRDMEKMTLRRMLVDGDILSLLVDGGAGEEGAVQLIEGHRCRRPQRATPNCVLGVLMDDRRRRLEYWITKDEVDPLQMVKLVSEVEKIPAFETDPTTGETYRSVLHVRNPKRPTQTRGVSAFAPVFDLMGMHEDIHFAELVKRQVTSCIAFIRTRDGQAQAMAIDALGKQTVETFGAQKRVVEELAPGLTINGNPGEKIEGFAPNIPGDGFLPHMRSMLQLIGANLGIPLVLLLMDASDTNFSGWRGAMDAARMGFKDLQQQLIDHWECPIYLWKLRQWAARDAGMRKALQKKVAVGTATDEKGRMSVLYRHEWHAPRWSYIQPLVDAQADDLRQRKLLGSPRRIHNQIGGDFDETVIETVEDNGRAIRKAAKEAKAITEEIGERVTWRDVLFMTDAEMLKAATASTQTGPDGKLLGTSPPPQPTAEAAVLNGAQITSLVDVFGKLRSGTLAPAAAQELLVAVGIDDARAKRAIAATPAGAGGAEADKEFFRQLLLAFAAQPDTRGIVMNTMTIGGDKGLSAGAGTPVNAEYEEPYVAVVAPAGQLVNGEVIKDPEGDIVGGDVGGGGTETQNAKGETQNGGAGGTGDGAGEKPAEDGTAPAKEGA